MGPEGREGGGGGVAYLNRGDGPPVVIISNVGHRAAPLKVHPDVQRKRRGLAINHGHRQGTFQQCRSHSDKARHTYMCFTPSCHQAWFCTTHLFAHRAISFNVPRLVGIGHRISTLQMCCRHMIKHLLHGQSCLTKEVVFHVWWRPQTCVVHARVWSTVQMGASTIPVVVLIRHSLGRKAPPVHST